MYIVGAALSLYPTWQKNYSSGDATLEMRLKQTYDV